MSLVRIYLSLLVVVFWNFLALPGRHKSPWLEGGRQRKNKAGKDRWGGGGTRRRFVLHQRLLSTAEGINWPSWAPLIFLSLYMPVLPRVCYSRMKFQLEKSSRPLESKSAHRARNKDDFYWGSADNYSRRRDNYGYSTIAWSHDIYNRTSRLFFVAFPTLLNEFIRSALVTYNSKIRNKIK